MKKHILNISIFLILILSSLNLAGQSVGDYRSVANTSWSLLTTWERWSGTVWATPTGIQGYPGQFAVPALVTILNSNNITLDVSPANNLGALTINDGGNNSSITFVGVNTLTVNGATNISSTTNNNINKFINVAGGSFITGTISLTGGGGTRDAYIQIGSGTVTTTDLTMAGGNTRAYILFSGTGTLFVSGSMTGGGITSTAGGGTNAPTSGTVNFNGTGAQTLPAYNYYNLTTSSARTTNNITFPNSKTIKVANIFNPSATFSTGGYIITNNTVDFNGTLSQNIPAFTFNNLTISGGGAKTLTGNVLVGGNLTLTNGIVTTTAANLLTVTNTASGAVTAGLATSYVKGPLCRTFANNGNATYNFPVGKSEYQLLEFNSTISGVVGSPTLTLEVFDLTPGNQPGFGMVTTNDFTTYWKMTKSGTATFSAASWVRLTKNSLSTTHTVAQSDYLNNATYLYNNKGGNIAGNTIQTSKNLDFTFAAGETYFVIGTVLTLCDTNHGGPYQVGTASPDNIHNLTDVATLLNDCKVICDVTFELRSDYDCTTETYPITFPQWSGLFTVTVRVKSGVTTRITQGSLASNVALITFDGSDKLIFDGRPGGVGTTSEWTIRNTQAAASCGATIELKNDATYNTLKYLTIEGNSSGNYGNINFGSGSSTGNDFNTISNCNIKDQTTTPTFGIYSVGFSTANSNDNNTITNCNIYNFFNSGSDCAGILIESYNSDWTISNNKIFQTAPRNFTAGRTYQGIVIYGSSSARRGNNFTVTGNTIGFANATGTGNTVLSSFGGKFIGIQMTVNATTASNIQNNLISNIQLTTTSTSDGVGNWGVFSGIYVTSGYVNVGTTSANTIGSTTTTGAIQINPSNNSAGIFGIHIIGGSTINISNNLIGGIQNNATNDDVNLRGIDANGTVTDLSINGNTIGSTAIANSIKAGTTNNIITNISGIYNATNANATITNNTIANLTVDATGAGQLRGIYTNSNTLNTISNNIIYNLTNKSNKSSLANSASIVGISSDAGVNNNQINDNKIYNLSNTNATNASITGIYAKVGNGTNNIYNNFINKYEVATNNSFVDGIYLDAGAANFYNNMIMLGTKIDGSSINNSTTFNGIYDNSLSVCKFYYNSIYLTGTAVTALTVNTQALYIYNPLTLVANEIKNNILINTRTNASGTGKHYACKIELGGYIISDYNIFGATDATYGYIANIDGVDRKTIRDLKFYWKTTILATYQDLHSGEWKTGVSLFSSPTTDLKLSANSCAYHTGSPLAGYTTDFENDARHATTPCIGADEGGSAITAAEDIFTPVITFASSPGIANQTTAIDVNFSTVVVTITDQGTGLDLAANLPRLYYRKTIPVGSQNWTSARYSVGTLSPGGQIDGNNSTWIFTITTADETANISPIAENDVVEYYIVAQDKSTVGGNKQIGYSIFDNQYPSHTTVSTPTYPATGPMTTELHSFSYIGNVPADWYVGSGQTYLTLTGAGGVFQNMNSLSINHNITVHIVSDIVEPGTYSLKKWVNVGGTWTLTIIPNNASLKTLSCTNTYDMIRMEGTDNVTIDGSFSNDANKWLTFINQDDNYATYSFFSDANNIVIKNITIKGTTTLIPKGVVWLGNGITTGNDNITISDNAITNGVTQPAYLVYCFGNAVTNSSNHILRNQISNFNTTTAGSTSYGVYLTTTGTGNSWEISDNHIFYNHATAPALQQTPISVLAGNGHTISGNYIGGQATNCGGSAWANAGTFNFTAINLASDNTGSASIVDNNVIKNFSLSNNASGTTFKGINITTALLSSVSGNTIGNGATMTYAGRGFTGISLTSNSSGLNINTNTISNITLSYTGSYTFTGLTATIGTASATTMQDNLVKTIDMSACTNTGNFIGITSLSSFINTGTGNTIGDVAVANSIKFNSTSTGTFDGIDITSNVIGNTISNNTVSGITETGTGTGTINGIYFTSTLGGNTVSNNLVSSITSTANATHQPIYLSFGTATTSTVSNNNIHTITLTSGTLTALTVAAGKVNATGNTIGNAIANNITCAGSNNTTGIYVNGSSANDISTNTVQNVKTTGNANLIAMNLALSSTNSTVNTNSIKSLNATNTSGSTNINGIWISTGLFTMASNTCTNITTAGTGTSNIINITSTTNGSSSITSNLISNVTSSSNTVLRAINLNVGGSSVVDVTSNTIYNFKNTGTGNAYLTGIELYNTGKANITQNIIGNSATADDFSNSGNGWTNGIYVLSGTSGSTISDNTLSNFTMTGNNYLAGIQVFQTGTGSATVLNNNTLNIFKSTNTGTSATMKGIIAGNANTGLYQITTNKLSNFTQSANGLLRMFEINVTTSGQTVTGNTMSNITMSTPYELSGIYFSAGTGSASTINTNTINTVNSTSVAGSLFYGINIPAGLISATGNIIGDVSNATSIQYKGTAGFYGIKITSSASANTISTNTIAGVSSTGASLHNGIYLSAATGSASTISNNIVQNINTSSVGSASFYGINVPAGLITATGNVIGDASNATSIQYKGTTGFNGIYIASSVGGNTISTNTIAGITSTATSYHNGIYLNLGTGSVSTINGNTIQKFVMSNGGSGTFYGINMNAGNGSFNGNLVGSTTDASSIQYASAASGTSGIYTNGATDMQNNTVQGFAGAASAVGSFYGLYLESGACTVGNTSANFVKDIANVGTGNIRAITITGASSGSSFQNNTVSNLSGKQNISGIYISSTNNYTISNNTIKDCSIPNTNNPTFVGIELFSVKTTTSTVVQNNKVENIVLDGATATFKGILLTTGQANIYTNTIGHATNANSINISNNALTYGIQSSSTNAVDIQTNTVANITSNGAATNAKTLVGIYVSGTNTNTVKSNTIYNLTTNSTTVGFLNGVYNSTAIVCSGAGTTTVSNNTIYNISQTGAGATIAAGISENSANTTISSNRIYDIKNSSTTGTAAGIVLDLMATATGANNNMISLGTAENPTYKAIWVKTSNTSAKNIIFNSVYIKGISTGTNNSYVFVRENFTTPVVIKNNIFVNYRDVSSTDKHYAIANLGTSTGWTANNNDLFSETLTTLGLWSATSYNFANWQTTTANDALSINNQPIFTDFTTANLHIDPANSCAFNGGGENLAAVTVDYDNQTRVHLPVPTDIGADEIVPTNGNDADSWRGWISIDWDNAQNWQCELAPKVTSNLTIPNVTNDPIIKRTLPATTVTINQLNILSTGILTVNAGNSLTLTGNFTNNGTISLESPLVEGFASGSFIDNGTITGTGQLIAKRFINALQWHEVSSPVATASSSMFTNNSTGYFNANFYTYNETIDLDGNIATNPTGAGAFDNLKLTPGWTFVQANSTAPAVNMTPNKGYMYYNDIDKVINFTGTPNTGNYDATGLTWTNNDPRVDANGDAIPELYDGWQLLGNPYPSSINWNLIRDDQITNIDDGIYTWDATGYSGYKNGLQVMLGHLTNNIPPAQGFFVHANATNASVQIRNEHRTHNAPEYLKSKDEKQNLLKIKTSANGWEDYFITQFVDNATTEYDGDFDMVRMFSNDQSIPQLYSQTLKSKDPLVLNCLPLNLMNNFADTLGLSIGNAGSYSFTIEEINDFVGINVVLEDRLLNKFVDLKTTNTYNFNFAGGNIKDRFVIHYNKSNSPILANPLQNQTVLANENINYQIPENTFVNNNVGDNLIITAKMQNGENLPSWLSFENNTFVGNTNQLGEYPIRVTATNNIGNSISSDFSIFVNETLNLNNLQTTVSIFPNPTSGKFTLNFSAVSNLREVKISNILGQTIYAQNNITTNQLEIDLSGFTKGFYNVQIQIDEVIINQKLILK